MKKILIVEDDGMVFKMLKNELDPSFFEIVRARAVDEAMGAIEEEGFFDCYIVDLWILASGLTVEEMDEYHQREGYAFLKHLWKEKTEDEVKELKRKTIICSRYVNNLKKEYRNKVDGLHLVLKDYKFEKKVTELVKQICQ